MSDLYDGHLETQRLKWINYQREELIAKNYGLTTLGAKDKVKKNDTIELYWDENELNFQLESINSDNIIFISNDYVILNKPAGIPSQPTLTLKHNDIISALHKYNPSEFKLNQLFLVHRLDKETSGIMIIARTKKFKTLIENQFKEKKVFKMYDALCYGNIGEKKFTLDYSIQKNPNEKNAYFAIKNDKITNNKSRSAMTRFELIKVYKSFNVSHLQCFPLTGRTHQIRVHLSAYGFPILGDKKYANNVIGHKSIGLALRHMLHASSIEFVECSGKSVRYFCELPKDFKNCLDTIK